MKILLAALPSIAGDWSGNLDGLHRTMRGCAGQVDLIVVAECFAQGFDVTTGDPVHDLAEGWTLDDPRLDAVRAWARECSMAVCLGFLERDGRTLHSTALVVGADGATLDVYRRVSAGWRWPDSDASVYVDGTQIPTFTLAGRRMAVALCGDLWDDPERFADLGVDVMVWPVFTSYRRDFWEGGEQDAYARQVLGVAEHVLLVNSLTPGVPGSPEGESLGGASWFSGGRVVDFLPLGEPGGLLVELPDGPSLDAAR